MDYSLYFVRPAHLLFISKTVANIAIDSDAGIMPLVTPQFRYDFAMAKYLIAKYGDITPESPRKGFYYGNQLHIEAIMMGTGYRPHFFLEDTKPIITRDDMVNFLESWWPTYGVADNLDQIIARIGEKLEQTKKDVIVLLDVRKQDENAGWRWHKAGTYIGTQEPEHEYFRDDKHIQEVVQWSTYEIITDDRKYLKDIPEELQKELK